MNRNSPLRIFGILFIIALIVIGVALFRSCQSPEDPQHYQDDDVTLVMPSEATGPAAPRPA